MRLATYLGPCDEPRAAAVVERDGQEHVVDLFVATEGALSADLLCIIEAGPRALEIARDAAVAGPRIPLSDVRLLAPLRRPPKLLATAGNYQAHVVEGGLPPVSKENIAPKLFLKPSTTIIGPADALQLTSLSSEVDWELELAVVIGTGGRDIPIRDASDAIFGYTIINDISARSMNWDIPNRAQSHWDDFFDWLNGKWIDGFAPMGPWIVTADDVPDPDDLPLSLAVNGHVWQQASTAEMIFTTAELVCFSSRIMTLEPGDVIATGTPAGVGATTGTFLNPGDRMEGRIEHIGTLSTSVSSAE